MIPISTDDVHELSTASSPDGNLPTKPAEVDTKLAEDTNSVEHNGKNEVGEVKEEDSTLSHREKGLEADTGATDSRVRAPYIVGWRLYALTFRYIDKNTIDYLVAHADSSAVVCA